MQKKQSVTNRRTDRRTDWLTRWLIGSVPATNALRESTSKTFYNFENSNNNDNNNDDNNNKNNNNNKNKNMYKNATMSNHKKSHLIDPCGPCSCVNFLIRASALWDKTAWWFHIYELGSERASERKSAVERVSEVSMAERAIEWAVRANKWMEEWVAQYLHLDSKLFLTRMCCPKTRIKRKQVPQGYIRCDYFIVTHCIIVSDFIWWFLILKNGHICHSKITRGIRKDGPTDMTFYRDAQLHLKNW